MDASRNRATRRPRRSSPSTIAGVSGGWPRQGTPAARGFGNGRGAAAARPARSALHPRSARDLGVASPPRSPGDARGTRQGVAVRTKSRAGGARRAARARSRCADRARGCGGAREAVAVADGPRNDRDRISPSRSEGRGGRRAGRAGAPRGAAPGDPRAREVLQDPRRASSSCRACMRAPARARNSTGSGI